MVNWLHLYSFFIQSYLQFASLIPIHTPTGASYHARRWSNHQEQFGVQRHFDMLTGGAGHQTANPVISKQRTLPAEPGQILVRVWHKLLTRIVKTSNNLVIVIVKSIYCQKDIYK